MFMRSVRVFMLAFVVVPVLAIAQPITDNGKVPFNPNVVTGKLSNGIPYYILKNGKPANRVDLILAVNAGAVLEEDDQNGYAHFCEHMAFNGTKSFPKQALVSFLESTGIRFGADLNAYTNQDETVYMLTVPDTKNDKTLNDALRVIRDWAGYVSYDADEIAKERGVVVEEWRLGKGADDRVRDKHNKVIFAGSKYADRDVIGDTNVLLHGSADAARRFYKKWYQPVNMAVIVVGDIDPADIEKRLKKDFVLTDVAKNQTVRPQIIPPGHADTKISIASDPELQRASVQLFIKGKNDTVHTYADYRKLIAKRLMSAMIQSRLGELAQNAKPPFAGAQVGLGSFVRELQVLYATATAADKNILKSFNALMTELIRAQRHGFVASELARAQASMMADMAKYYNERSTTESQPLAMELVRHVLTRESVTGIEHEYAIYQHYVPLITPEECHAILKEAMTPENRVITFSVPEGNGYNTPTEQQVRSLLAAVESKDIAPYADKTPTKPLMSIVPAPGSITKREKLAEVGAEKWTLSNGATVVIKPTDFKSDEILMSAWAFGGQSLGPDDKHFTLAMAATLVDASGISEFDPNSLQKMLQGKTLELSPYIQMETQGFNGSCSPTDLQTYFELLNLYFTAPRLDADAVSSMKTRLESVLANRSEDPQSVLVDSATVILADHHPRSYPLTSADISKIDENAAFAFYKERFADPANFTFTFVGNINPAELEGFVTSYLASIPSPGRKENWKDVGMHAKRGKIEKTIYKGTDPKSMVSLMIGGDFKYTPETRYEVISLCEVMGIRLREQMREEKSGVYFVNVIPQLENIPNQEYSIIVMFGCAPERVDEMIAIVEKEIAYLRMNVVDASYVQKVKEIQTKEREVTKTNNRFWANVINQILQTNEPWSAIARRDELIAALTPEQVRESAVKYLNTINFAKFVLKPEQK
ncbi:MAG: insulinase family protein [Ignavibacteriae bacterium]|nr:MAG: insulinase family protein [Ignavibacteriota bacterium]